MRQKKSFKGAKETRQDKTSDHGVVMLGTVQCRPAAACARKSPSRVHSKETRQDKTSDALSTSPTKPHKLDPVKRRAVLIIN
jgi:hypothetical protein